MDKPISIKVNDEKLSTGAVLDLMDLQSQLSGDNPSRAMRQMVELLQTAVIDIEYDGQKVESLMQLPFRKLQPAISQIMAAVNQTDPNLD